MQPEYALLCAVCGLCSPPHHCMSCCSADSQGTASSQALLPKPHKAPSMRTLVPVKLTVSVCVFPGSFFMSAFPAKKQVVGIDTTFNSGRDRISGIKYNTHALYL